MDKGKIGKQDFEIGKIDKLTIVLVNGERIELDGEEVSLVTGDAERQFIDCFNLKPGDDWFDDYCALGVGDIDYCIPTDKILYATVNYKYERIDKNEVHS